MRHARSAVLLRRVMDSKAAPVPWLSYTLTERETSLQLDGSTTRARLYVPVGAHDAPGIVLLHGVHPRGIDEARLIAFARSVVAVGVNVLTPELPELLRYRIDDATVEHIAELARVHAQSLGTRAVGVIGISFAGGLALMAADHARSADAISFVVAIGAHHDLHRLTRYYAGQEVTGPHAEKPDVAPHPYGARVMLRQHLARFFSEKDVGPATTALDLYLGDQHARAKHAALALTAEGQRTMAILLETSHDEALGELLMQAAGHAERELEAASPAGKLSHVRAAVFLVHGERDPVIPSLETRFLARELPAHALHRVVITPLLRHAEFPSPPTLGEAWDLLSLMAEVLRQAEATRFRSPRTSL